MSAKARRLEEFAAAIIPPHASLGQEPALPPAAAQRGDLDEVRHVLDADPGAYVWTDVDYQPARRSTASPPSATPRT
jgi:hypothetical protein